MWGWRGGYRGVFVWEPAGSGPSEPDLDQDHLTFLGLSFFVLVLVVPIKEKS